MSSNIRHELVEERSKVLHPVPREWGMGLGPYYMLDLKMCQIKSLKYDFYWGDEGYVGLHILDIFYKKV